MNDNIINFRASDGSVVKLETHDSLGSTVNLTRAYAKLGYPDRYVVMTEKRAKLDNEGKVKGYDNGIFMSCILRPSIFPSQATLITPLAAVAFAQALEEHTECKLGLGWVGNLYGDGKLIGNVSIEGKLDNFTSYEYLIVSFSVVMSEKYFPTRISDMIKKVFSPSETTIPVIIAEDILDKFFPLYQDLKGSSKFMDTYRQKFALRGEYVHCVRDGKRRKYKVLGVDDKNCSLMLEGKDGKMFEVSSPNSVTVPKKIRI